MWKKQSLRTLLVGIGNSAAALENCLAVPCEGKHEVGIDPAIPLLPILVHPRETKTHIHTKASAQMLIAALFVKAKKQKPSKCPSLLKWKKLARRHTASSE